MYDDKATCAKCNGEGELYVSPPGLPRAPNPVGCSHCMGSGECGCSDCMDKASEAAWERRYEDFHGGSGPLSLDEQHRRAWQQKQELRR